MDPITVSLAGGGVMAVKNAYEKSKWCACGHRHKKKSSSSKGTKRKEGCSEPGCPCSTFRTQANDAELVIAKKYAKGKRGLKRLFGLS